MISIARVEICVLTDFCPLGGYRPIKNINLYYEKFSQKSLILSKMVTRNLPK